MAISKIKKSEIDFNKIYGNSADAMNHNNNTVKVNEKYWGDNDELTFDDETGLISEGNQGLGFINKNDLLSIQKVEEKEAGFTPGNPQSPIVNNPNATDQSVNSFNNNIEENVMKFDNDSSGNTSILKDKISQSANKIENLETININQTAENKDQVTVSNNNVSMEESVSDNSIPLGNEYKPEDFNFKHESSNILAAKAKNMGFTDEQVKIAIGISRWETGNYNHLSGGYNYGGVTGSGDAGSNTFYDRNGNPHTYAAYSSADVGMDAFLANLKKNYFDLGLNSVESMARKYLGYDATDSWINGVYGCMS